MDILKKLINNPVLQHVAEVVIGHLDKDFAKNLAENREYRELFTGGEQDFLMKTLKKSMYEEAKEICEYLHIFDTFPFFAEALEELKSGESLLTFQQLQKTLSLLENLVTVEIPGYLYIGLTPDPIGFKLACLHRCVPDETDEQDAKKGPEDMIKTLEKGKEYWAHILFEHLIDNFVL